MHWKTLGALALLGAGILGVAGCKSTPPLTVSQATALLQAKYDARTPTPISIQVTKLGMNMGITDDYWKLTKLYPNKYWADYTLTEEGKKAVQVPGGGIVMQWRPDSPNSPNYAVTIQTVVTSHLKARDVQTPQSEVLPGVATSQGAQFDESVDLTGLPQALQDIARNPGNQLSVSRQADFALENGQWVLHGIN